MNADEQKRVATLEGELAAERAKTKALSELLEATRNGAVSFLLGRADIVLEHMVAHVEQHFPGSATAKRARELRTDVAAFMKGKG